MALVSVLALAGTPAASSAEGWQAKGLEVADELALVGARLDTSRVEAGGPLSVSLRWLTLAAPRDGYGATVRLEAVDGSAHEAHWAYGPLMRSWERGELVMTETNVRIPAGFPSGVARVWLRVEGRDGKAGPGIDPILLGEASIPAGRATPTDRSFGIPHRHELIPGLELASFEICAENALGQTELRPGGALDANLDWLARGTPSREPLAVLHLRGPGGEIASRPHTIGSWFNLPGGWQIGDRFRQQVRMAIPPAQPTGSYAVSLRIYTGDPRWTGLAPHSSFSSNPRGRPTAEVPLGQVSIQP